MPELSQAQIDTAAIPDFRKKELAQSVLESLERALSLPGAEEDFQAWLKQYKKTQSQKKKGVD